MVLARVAVALTVGVGLLGDAQVLRDIWLLPLRDFFGLGFWAWSYASTPSSGAASAPPAQRPHFSRGLRRLIRRRPLDVIDDEDVDGGFDGVELQPELLLDGGE